MRPDPHEYTPAPFFDWLGWSIVVGLIIAVAMTIYTVHIT